MRWMMALCALGLMACGGSKTVDGGKGDAPAKAAEVESPVTAIDRDPTEALAAARAEHAACKPVPPASGAQFGELRIIDLRLEGDFTHAAKVVLHVTMAEVSGREHMAYPGIMIEFSDNAGLPAVTPETLYGITGCGTTEARFEFEAPAYVAPGTAITITAHASQPLTCKDAGECVRHHSVSLVRELRTAGGH